MDRLLLTIIIAGLAVLVSRLLLLLLWVGLFLVTFSTSAIAF